MDDSPHANSVGVAVQEEEEDPVLSPQQQQRPPPQSPMASSSSSRKRRAAARDGDDDEEEDDVGVDDDGDHLVSDPDVEEDGDGEDEGDGEGEDVDSSSLRPPVKKPRRKDPSSCADIDIDMGGGGSSSSSSLDKENGVNGGDGRGGRARTGSSNKKNKNSASNANRQSLVNAALGGTTAVQRNVNQPGARAEAGLISKIYCENFMCHRKLTVELCQNINFIYGQNGSGKSAILAALQICLGAKAGRTHRARNLKDLVRKDAGDTASAKIRVTLTNRGEDAYEPETYGDLITVERSIALKGGYNGFKLLDSKGVEQSRQRKDLDDMLDKLNIQVENPVALLDQEESKKFLTGKSSDKYNFFMKATELERVDLSYAKTLDEVESLRNTANRMNNTLQHDRDMVSELKQKYKEHQKIAKLETKQAETRAHAAWAVYKESMQEVRAEEQKMREFEDKAEQRRKKLQKAEAMSQEDNTGGDELRERIDSLSKEAADGAEHKRDLEQQLKKAQEPVKALERQIKALQKEERKAEKNVHKAKERLQQKRDQIAATAGSAESEQALRTQQVQELDAKLNEGKPKLYEVKQEMNDLHSEYENKEPDIREAHNRVSDLKNQMRGVQSAIKNMESSSGNSLSVFGPNCAALKSHVDDYTRRGKFKGPVRGPLGSYCKVTPGKEAFAKVAELSLGAGALDRFVVTNHHDRKILQSIRNQLKCRDDCGIFLIGKHPRYDIPEPPPFDGIETVSTVLTIEDDLVFNCLVDHCKIDERALARSKEESEKHLLRTEPTGKHFIVGGKIKDVFFLPRGDQWKITKGGHKQLSSNTRQMKRTIGVDNREAIRQKEEDLDRLEEEMKAADREHSRLDIEHTDLKKRWKAKKIEMQRLEKSLEKWSDEIDEIRKQELDAADIGRDVDTSAEEEEVAETEAILEETKERHQKATDEMTRQQPEVGELAEKVTEVTARNDKIMADLDAAEKEVAKVYSSQRRQEDKIVKEREKVKQFEEIIAKHTEKVEKAKGESEDFLYQARKNQYDFNLVEERRKQRENHEDADETQGLSEYTQEPSEEDIEAVPIPDFDKLRDLDYYTARVEHLGNKIEEEKQRRLLNQEDEATAYEKYVRAKQVLRGKEKKLAQTETLVEKLQHDLNRRRERWEQFRTEMSKRTTIRFNEILHIKGSSGAVEFDHEQQELNLIVQKDARDENSQQSDVKALSGGERSYTTIALLCALGETLETPFRVMDEFDVFLDPMTRKVVIEQLIAIARKMSHRQFIFITPQDVSSVETDAYIKILKMKPPERLDRAGGLTQQTIN
mmetsp:Transcript_3048/g.6871  ORF Transcript_3048/g.6871 Transcript_3048/m.6871 type:complete len:1302 (+) Transcript_3048:476-4381(+)